MLGLLILALLPSVHAMEVPEPWSTGLQDRAPTRLALSGAWHMAAGRSIVQVPELVLSGGWSRKPRIGGGLALRLTGSGLSVPAEDRGHWTFGVGELTTGVFWTGRRQRPLHSISYFMSFGPGVVWWRRPRDATSMGFGLRYTGYLRPMDTLHIALEIEASLLPILFAIFTSGHVSTSVVYLPMPGLAISTGMQFGSPSLSFLRVGIAGRPLERLEIGFGWMFPLLDDMTTMRTPLPTMVRPSLEIRGWWDKGRWAQPRAE